MVARLARRAERSACCSALELVTAPSLAIPIANRLRPWTRISPSYLPRAARDASVPGRAGPKMLELSRDRTAGTHPYLVTPEHSAMARELLGPNALLAPEQGVVLETDPGRARELARQSLNSMAPSQLCEQLAAARFYRGRNIGRQRPADRCAFRYGRNGQDRRTSESPSFGRRRPRLRAGDQRRGRSRCRCAYVQPGANWLPPCYQGPAIIVLAPRRRR